GAGGGGGGGGGRLPRGGGEPVAPTSLVARSMADGVEVAWHRPDKYSGGQHMRDLGGFDIERAPVDGPQAGTFVLVNHMELTDQYRFRIDPRTQWIDHDVEAGTRYQYRVTAFTLHGYRSSTAGPVSVHYVPQPDTHPK